MVLHQTQAELVDLVDLEVVQLIIILQDMAQEIHLPLVQDKVQMVEQEVQILETLICLVVEAERLIRVVEGILVVEMVEMEQQQEFQDQTQLTLEVAEEVIMDQLVQELQVKEDLVVAEMEDNLLVDQQAHQQQEDLMDQMELQTLVVEVVVELELTHQMVVVEQMVDQAALV